MKKSAGFTLIELLLVMAIFGILSSFAIINLIRPQTKASLDTVTTTLVTELASQQLKSMVGDASGVYIQANQYSLFSGTSYVATSSANFVVSQDSDIALSTSFPSSQVVFSKISGEVASYADGSNTITVSSGGESKVITINRYGVISIQ